MEDHNHHSQLESSQFRTTHWSIIIEAGAQDSAIAGHALQRLCQTYWYPLYAFVCRQGEKPHDAQDMVQGFFEQFIAKAFIKDINRNRGRFRSFLLASLKHYMANQWKRAKTQKRGGGAHIISIDAQEAEDRYSIDPGHELSPDRIFDRSWVLALLDTVLIRLESEYKAQNKAKTFTVLKDCLVERKTTISRADQASTLGISEQAVKVAVYRLRKRYRHCLYETVAETLLDPSEVDTELIELFNALKS